MVGAGQLVAVFDLPRENDNFAAIAGIFEEGNGVSQRRGKREIGEQIARDSTIRLLAIVIFDLGQIEKTGTIFFN